jgi:hypothetical protein
VSSSETSIHLDTGAFGAARRRRFGRTLAYWTLLVLGAAVTAGVIAAASVFLTPGTQAAKLATTKASKGAASTARATAAGNPTPALGAAPAVGAAPPPRTTPVAVWNGFGGQGAGAEIADRARGAGYPVVGVRDAPRRTYRRSYVLYVPGQRAAARALVKRLALTKVAVRPLDGIPPTAIAPAKLLVILAG